MSQTSRNTQIVLVAIAVTILLAASLMFTTKAVSDKVENQEVKQPFEVTDSAEPNGATSEGQSRRFDLSEKFWADCVTSDGSRAGRIYHIVRNSSGGSNSTPIAFYFCWRPKSSEGYHAHWRVDCFVREHQLSPPEMQLAKELIATLVQEELISEPIWASAHRSKELDGFAIGELFDD